MPASPFHPERITPPPFIEPYLETLDRMQRETLRPDQVTDRARALLANRYGASQQTTEAAFAHGVAGLLSGHTHYFNGFAVLMSLPQGTAVAVRETKGTSQLVFEGSDSQWSFDRTLPEEEANGQAWPIWACIVRDIVQQLGKGNAQLEVAVVSTVPAVCMEGYVSALGIAATRALQALYALPDSTSVLIEKLNRIISTCADMPFSTAYLIAADAGRPQAFTLVDTAVGEQLPLAAPARDVVGWGLVDVGHQRLEKTAVHWELKEKAEKALAVLNKRGYEHLTSFRDLDHQELKRALGLLPRRYRPVVRHLVAENHRVQRMVFAVRKKDWQMFGALLLMSHASLRDDWKQTNEEVDLVVEHVEAMSLDGMYGATVSGHGGCVLVVGQPFVVPRSLERITAAYEERFGEPPRTMLL